MLKQGACALLFALAVTLEQSSALDDPTVVRPGDIDYTTQSFTEITDDVFYARAYDSFSDQVIVEGNLPQGLFQKFCRPK